MSVINFINAYVIGVRKIDFFFFFSSVYYNNTWTECKNYTVENQFFISHSRSIVYYYRSERIIYSAVFYAAVYYGDKEKTEKKNNNKPIHTTQNTRERVADVTRSRLFFGSSGTLTS